MKKILFFITSLLMVNNVFAKNISKNRKNTILDILKDAKVIIKSESSDDGGRTGGNGGGNVGPKPDK